MALTTTKFSLTNSPSLLSNAKNHNSPTIFLSTNYSKKFSKSSLPWSKPGQTSVGFLVQYRYNHRTFEDEEENEEEDCSFEDAVFLFNRREYYKCHDFLESLWMKAEDPKRTLFHGILQCAVGFHHLFNQNHKGAMLELGEGVCKLRKLDFQSGPFHKFEQEISAVLQFIYKTQIEHAACSDDLCVAMDQSERSYQLLGGYGAGQVLYTLELDPLDGLYILFSPQTSYSSQNPPRVKLPVLHATNEHLLNI